MLNVINLYGGPGTGKSTVAARLYSQLKVLDYNVELVTEFAKDLVYEHRNLALDNQLYILGEMYHKLYRLEDKVEWAIIDSPLLLNNVYKGRNPRLDFIDTNIFKTLVKSIYDNFNNYNILLKRDEHMTFSEIGRIQNLDESKKIDELITQELLSNQCDYKIVLNDINNIDITIDEIFLYIKE